MRLAGGDINEVVLLEGTVRRPVGPWTPAVHALLRHFESVGFDGAPRVLGIDEEGREILAFIEGDPGFAPVPAGDEAVGDLGRLVRRMHDAQRGFRPPDDAHWQRHVGQPETGEVICHLDLFWTNVIFRDGLPVALIDWELAAPGSRLLDVASAAAYWAPIRRDDDAVDWGLPVDRRGERLRLLCDGYGLAARERAGVLDALIAQRRRALETHRLWGGLERRPGWADMWDGGSEARILANLRFVEEHREELEPWLR